MDAELFARYGGGHGSMPLPILLALIGFFCLFWLFTRIRPDLVLAMNNPIPAKYLFAAIIVLVVVLGVIFYRNH